MLGLHIRTTGHRPRPLEKRGRCAGAWIGRLPGDPHRTWELDLLFPVSHESAAVGAFHHPFLVLLLLRSPLRRRARRRLDRRTSPPQSQAERRGDHPDTGVYGPGMIRSEGDRRQWRSGGLWLSRRRRAAAPQRRPRGCACKRGFAGALGTPLLARLVARHRGGGERHCGSGEESRTHTGGSR